jgi:flagellar basal body L-ring protein FlgH
MAPFEMLYGHRCQTPLFWSETGEWKVFKPDIMQEAEKQVHMVQENLRVAQSRQKSYTDRRRRKLSFKVGDFVYINVTYERFASFQATKQARIEVHWTIQDFGEKR